MNVRSLILVVVAITVAGIAALLARNLMSGQPAPVAAAAAPPVAGTKVLVAAVALPVGRLVEVKDFRWQSWPDGNVDDSYFLEGRTDAASLVGKVVRVGVAIGQPVTQGNLVGPGEQGFLAAILGPGMRAVTVAVTDTSGVAGFVFPGDRVDLVLSQDIESGDGPTRRAAETVLRNVRVLAVDQSTNDQDNLPKLVRTVTLEVTPQLVEYVSVMGRIGQLSLSLRPLASEKAEAGPDGKPLVTDIADPTQPTAANGTVTMDRQVSKALSMVGFSRGSGGAPAAAPAATPGGQAAAPTRPSGPTVVVTRGSELTTVSVGGGK